MKRNQVQHFIDGHRVTKRDFLNRNDEEMRTAYIRQGKTSQNALSPLSLKFNLARV